MREGYRNVPTRALIQSWQRKTANLQFVEPEVALKLLCPHYQVDEHGFLPYGWVSNVCRWLDQEVFIGIECNPLSMRKWFDTETGEVHMPSYPRQALSHYYSLMVTSVPEQSRFYH